MSASSGTFARGHYQGIATEHAVAFDLPPRDTAAQPQKDEHVVLVAVKNGDLSMPGHG